MVLHLRGATVNIKERSIEEEEEELEKREEKLKKIMKKLKETGNSNIIEGIYRSQEYRLLIQQPRREKNEITQAQESREKTRKLRKKY
ncbi:hypothetical protein K6025_03420 [Ehrlichia sp. JZT12]